MTRNQLPEGVGKKIVEALKRQQEADITPVDAEENSLETNIPLTNMQDLPDLNFDSVNDAQEINDNVIVEEDTAVTEPKIQENIPLNEQNIMEKPVFGVANELAAAAFANSTMNLTEEIKSANTSIRIPQNVAILKNLIASLPVGVTKQTGAQIIRQTLEAMGLPMNNVLKEAQEVQEQLNSSTRECMLKIQEYKTNILQLEQSVQEYQKNITQINDLVSLFLLTDRK